MDKKEYALDTMNEGVLIITKDGRISYANSKAKEIFSISDEHSVLFHTVLSDPGGRNDELIDLVIDIISSGEVKGRKMIHYFSGDKQYALFSSCTRMDDNAFVFTFTDQTDLAVEVQKRHDATLILLMFFMEACLWTIGVSIWMRFGDVSGVDNLTIVLEMLAAATILLFLRKTSLRLKDMGLSFQNIRTTVRRTVIRLLGLLGLFCVVKCGILLVRPDYFQAGVPFWDWKQVDFRLIKYFFTSLIQELLSRGGMQSAMGLVIDGKYAKHAAIFLTSIFFMFLHFPYGLPMMLGSGVLSVVLGYICKKDGNIYGATMVHYCFGKFADFLHLI